MKYLIQNLGKGNYGLGGTPITEDDLFEIGGGDFEIVGTPNYVSKFADPTGLTEGVLYDTGTRLGMFTENPLWDIHVQKSINQDLQLVLRHANTNRYATNNVITDNSGVSIASFGSTYTEVTSNGHTSRWAGKSGLYINTQYPDQSLNLWIGTRTILNALPTGETAIGQADPQAWLHVQGNLRIDNVPSGTGDSLLIDANGDVVRGSGGGGGGSKWGQNDNNIFYTGNVNIGDNQDNNITLRVKANLETVQKELFVLEDWQGNPLIRSLGGTSGTRGRIEFPEAGTVFGPANRVNTGFAFQGTNGASLPILQAQTVGGAVVFEILGNGRCRIHPNGTSNFILGTDVGATTHGAHLASRNNNAGTNILRCIDSSANLRFQVFAGGNISMNNLPTSDPLIAGYLWRSGNDLKISLG